MLIGIDGNEANVGERVGVNVWAYEVLKGLRGMRGKRGIRWVIYLSKPPLADLPTESKNWRYRVIGPGGLWTRWRLPIDLYFHRPRPEVFLSLSHYAPKWAPMPRVVCIMDLSFLKFPEAFKPAVRWQLTNWTAESVRNAAHIITISEFNKREIEREYRCPAEKITVVYPGVSDMFKGFRFQVSPASPRLGRGRADFRFQEITRVREKYDINRKYLLFVGTRQPKKNLGRLIEAFGVVRQKFPNMQLVVAGKAWGQFTEAEVTGYLKVGPYQTLAGVKFLGYVPAEDLPALVAGAEALVIPSLYEGFGIPAVVAMSMGTPVLASNVTSLPEIIGDHANGRAGAGILFDPYDTKDMADKICRLLEMSKAERQRLVEKGKIRARLFNWDSAAEKVLDILKVAAGNSENG